jgi:uncharacterized protein (DUF58 family)
VGRIWWIAVGVTALAGAIQVNRLLLILSLLLALVGGASLLWARYCLAGVTYRRHFTAPRIFLGEETDLLIETTNAKPLPLAWLQMTDEFPADVDLLTGVLHRSLNPRRRLLVNTLALRWYERVTRRYRLRGKQRGVWVFGPALLSSGDIFGLSVRRAAVEDVATLVVYPRILPISALGLPTRFPFGDSPVQQRIVDDPLLVTGARDYVPGDSYRSIHWKATAHRRSLQTKVLDPSARLPLAIFVNIRTSPQAALRRDLLELALSVAASIAHWGWEHGYATGLFANSTLRPGGERVRIPPATHPDRLQWILEALARVDVHAPWSLATVLLLESAALSYGSTVVVISPLLSERLKRALADLRRREHSVTLVTVGDARDEDLSPGIQTYHVGNGWFEGEVAELELAG